MGQIETLIEEAIEYAKQRGVKIVRRTLCDWCIHDNGYDSHWASYPIACNALGAILLKLGKENLAKESFDPDWLKVICFYLDKDPFWVSRFVSGFDYANEITLIHVKKKEDKKVETHEFDKVSRYGNKLARKTCGEFYVKS